MSASYAQVLVHVHVVLLFIVLLDTKKWMVLLFLVKKYSTWISWLSLVCLDLLFIGTVIYIPVWQNRSHDCTFEIRSSSRVEWFEGYNSTEIVDYSIKPKLIWILKGCQETRITCDFTNTWSRCQWCHGFSKGIGLHSTPFL